MCKMIFVGRVLHSRRAVIGPADWPTLHTIADEDASVTAPARNMVSTEPGAAQAALTVFRCQPVMVFRFQPVLTRVKLAGVDLVIHEPAADSQLRGVPSSEVLAPVDV